MGKFSKLCRIYTHDSYYGISRFLLVYPLCITLHIVICGFHPGKLTTIDITTLDMFCHSTSEQKLYPPAHSALRGQSPPMSMSVSSSSSLATECYNPDPHADTSSAQDTCLAALRGQSALRELSIAEPARSLTVEGTVCRTRRCEAFAFSPDIARAASGMNFHPCGVYEPLTSL